jgi:carboxymethylenebutenolidase
MDQKIINLYDKFTHGFISRREFLDKLTEVAGSAAAAAAILPMLQNNYALAAIVPENDPRLVSETVSYDWPKGKVSGYLVRPKEKGKRPAVIVIHENRGLNPHIPDVARRFALEGFLVLAPDLLSVTGGTPSDDDKARDQHNKTDREDIIAEAVAAVAFLKKHPESTGKVGAVGFCFGGGVVNRMATDNAELDAAAVYYGPQPPADKVAAIKAPLLLHYGALDENIGKGIPAYEAALKAGNKKYTIYMYEGANHAFNNDTGGPRYNKEAADLAFGRTVAFLKETLGAPPKAG